MNAPLVPAPGPLDALDFDNSFARLPEAFYTRLAPTPLPDPYLVHANADMAAAIGLPAAALASRDFLETFAGNRIPAAAAPLAAVYSGHQFGVWAGQLGDGRAILLGEARHGDTHWELQLKGSGLTPYSRMGDGRAVLRSSIREYLCAEAMHHLGIPTTRSLALVGSDQPVVRETVETAAVCTRSAPSFVRFGSFEHWFYRNRSAELAQLADYVIDRFLPACREAPQPYLALLQEATRRTADLIAQWQAVGFCHGVMNTDNMSILGLTLDYGPFGFMEAFDAATICNHSDEGGRYAYAMQPGIAHWNLYCLGQALLPLLPGVEETQAVLESFKPAFLDAYLARLRRKLGLRSALPGDAALIESVFELMQAHRVDFTLFFRNLASVRATGPEGDAPVRDLFIDRAAFDAWAREYRGRLAQEAVADAERAAGMNTVNPRYVLRNHLAEVAIRKARDERDFSEVDRLFRILSRPYDEQPEHAAYAALPPDWASGLQVSCSS
jgi:uncharacterized protein YdiU (UPF0061 family)